ncbi:hypothetical protein BDL97_05G006700 [Sphagnum fallax]|nr:hypothetical protein BDL97_05G006700 [Sphagnum fallax]
MKVIVMTDGEKLITVDVDPEEPVENLKAILEVETGVSLINQQILLDGRELQDTMQLRAAGLKENSMLKLISKSAPSSAGWSNASNWSINPDGSATNPIALQKRLRGDTVAMAQLQQRNPEIAQAVMQNDIELFQRLLQQQHQRRLDLKHQSQQSSELSNADPFDVDAQKRIEESIRQKNVYDNWEAALEYNPESFARVIMLYVDMEVNGIALKAFVDSGAQSTIISKNCAERCGLLRLLDRQYTGIAKGVGQSEIVGRIHVAPLKIGRNYYPCSFTVLDQSDLEFIFGLDMLRKHQCTIDLKENKLWVGGGEITVPFLQENDLPLHLHDDTRLEELPSSAGTTSSSLPVELGPPVAMNSPIRSTHDGKKRARSPQASEWDGKVQRLVELGFDKNLVLHALRLFQGDEDQAAGYLFGG